MTLYKGFSFKNWQNTKSFVLTDVALVNQDIKNHFFTRLGERRGMAQFGTTIQDTLFQPLDDDTVVAATEQVRFVIDYDPRVILRSDRDFDVAAEFDKGLLYYFIRLYYVELELADIFDLRLEFRG